MKILMVLSDNTYPPDIRVEKEADALLKAGAARAMTHRHKKED